MSSPRWRIALYSHDAMGIGHIRRNLLIARALAERGDTDVLLICGVAEAGAFDFPPHVDCLTLPSLRKDTKDGAYHSRRLTVQTQDLVNLRAAAIRAALDVFAPHLLIVDKVPRGVAAELAPTLQSLSATGKTRIVLGLRDILDEAAVVRKQWQVEANAQAIERYYDRIWIYGDRRVYDPVTEYEFDSRIAAKVQFTGYLRRIFGAASPPKAGAAPDSSRHAICMSGGGEDGAPLALAFARAPLPKGWRAIVVTGPFMDSDAVLELRDISDSRSDLRIVEFIREPAALLASSDCIVTMGGYNAVSEALCAGKPTLVVPRVSPRREQWIRATRLAGMRIVDVLHPDELTPSAVAQWICGAKPAPTSALEQIDFGGLERIPNLARDLMEANPNGSISASASDDVQEWRSAHAVS